MKYFIQHDIKLSPVTFQYHRVSLMVGGMSAWMIFVILLLDVLLIFGLLSLPKGVRWLSQVWVFGVLIAIMLFFYFGGVAMGLPFFGTEET